MKLSNEREKTLLASIEVAVETTDDRPEVQGTASERSRPDIGCWGTIEVENLIENLWHWSRSSSGDGRSPFARPRKHLACVDRPSAQVYRSAGCWDSLWKYLKCTDINAGTPNARKFESSPKVLL